jgi:3-deoxy-D-manno-octulosonic-acid transferase
LLVNGRISARSYPRYRLIRPLFRRVLDDVDRFCVQGARTRERLVDLGADPDRIIVTGSLKFDALQLAPASQRVLRFFRVPASRPVIVAGSTMRGEEPALLTAFLRLRGPASRPLLVIAPRHPERFGEVERLASQTGLATARRSDLPIDQEPDADVVILDTIGELAALYQIATVVFVGGSLVDAGGHNILEPAIYARPILFGPYMQNFAEIADAFLEAEAAVQVRSEGALETALVDLLADAGRRERLGEAARAIVEANRGARDKTMAAIVDLLPPGRSRRVGAGHSLRVVQ